MKLLLSNLFIFIFLYINSKLQIERNMALKDFSANIFGQNIDRKLSENLKLGSQCFSETD